MTMTGLKISKTLLAVMLTSAVATGSAYAENSTTDKTQSGVESAGQKVDSSMNKVGNFMDDSTITAKVKAALVDHDSIKSTDISVSAFMPGRSPASSEAFVPSSRTVYPSAFARCCNVPNSPVLQ